MAYLCGGFFYAMTIQDSNYRLHLDITYTTTGNANTARTNINSTLAGQGRSETAGGTGTNVLLIISGLTEAEATSLRDSLISAWSGVARTGGKAAIARSNA